ncbi:unnamed protein product [Gordionus sp. m RMFG-2023]
MTTLKNITPNKEAMLLSMKKQLKDNISSIIDNFSEIVKIAKIEEIGQVSKSTQNEQELFEAQVRAANMVRASQSLLKLISDLKLLYILNDFKSINESVAHNCQEFKSLQLDCNEKLKIIREEMTSHLYELEDEYYSSLYK